MSDIWSEGYFTGLGYTYGYYRETSPVYQRFCLLLRGLEPQAAASRAAHCELGFGQGVSININAASNPGEFVGTDFNPAHAAHARALSGPAGSDKRFYDDSFEQLLARDDLPAFDSISLHGIWTWVSRDNHGTIVRFVKRHLKPGGVLYVSYNCFPGWAPAHPLRQLFALHDRYAPGSADATRRIDNALKFSGELLASGTLFGRASPGLDDRLKKITAQNRDYLAHEYFNRDWNCMYFTEVADILAEAKLAFAATAEPLDAVDSVNPAPAGIAFLNGIEHPMMREQIRDYFVNRQFRKDLYMRGARQLSTAGQREQMLATRIVLERPVSAIPMTVNGAQGEATLHQNVFGPVLEQLAAADYAPKSFNDLARALPALSLAQLMMVGAVLVGAGHAAPCHAELTVEQVGESCELLNRHLLERARTRDEVNFLASPVTGAGVAVGRFQQLFLLARRLGHDRPEAWARFTWQLLTDQGQQLVKSGKTLETPEENLAELNEAALSFAGQRLPVLKAAGIV